jgi:hypothetical protein
MLWITWAIYVENMEKSNVYKDLVRKAGGKRLLG